MIHLILIAVFVVALAVPLRDPGLWWVPPLTLVFIADGPVRRFLVATARRIWRTVKR